MTPKQTRTQSFSKTPKYRSQIPSTATLSSASKCKTNKPRSFRTVPFATRLLMTMSFPGTSFFANAVTRSQLSLINSTAFHVSDVPAGRAVIAVLRSIPESLSFKTQETQSLVATAILTQFRFAEWAITSKPIRWSSRYHMVG